jgi:hypothetical protein
MKAKTADISKVMIVTLASISSSEKPQARVACGGE